MSLTSHLNLLPALFNAVLDPALRRAGHIAVVTMVGPVPNKGGQVDVQT